MSKNTWVAGALALCAAAGAASSALARQDASPAGSRTTLAIRYQEGKSTEIRMEGTPASPHVHGKAEVKARNGSTSVEMKLESLPSASTFGADYATYVLWEITPEGATTNLGEFPWKGDAKIRASLPIQRFALIVTAEPYGTVTAPSPRVVAENRLKQGESVASTSQISYGGDAGELYLTDSAVDAAVAGNVPAPVAAARLSVIVAQRAGADKFARGELTQANSKLAEMEAAFKEKPKNEGSWGSFARETARLAHVARINAGDRAKQVALTEEREAQAAAIDKARADAAAAADTARAEQQRAAAERASAERALAAQQAAAAEAERARAAAAGAQQQAAEALKAAQQASAERDAMRQKLEQSLSAILDTRREARGIVVNLGDVLFDTGKSTLRPEAREKLSRMAGILIAYPGEYTLSFEGHTDSTGSDELNMRLSQARAEAVRDYLLANGVRADRVVGTQGFGKSQPVASNDTSEGRQLNRRVEIVVDDQAH